MFCHQTVECGEWLSLSHKKNEEIDISLTLDLKEEAKLEDSQSLSIQHLLYNHFLTENLSLETHNQYFWSECDKFVNTAKINQKLDRNMPPIVMVTLNRFYYDRKSKQRKKRLDPIIISPSITIPNQYFHTPTHTEQKEDLVYDLYVSTQKIYL